MKIPKIPRIVIIAGVLVAIVAILFIASLAAAGLVALDVMSNLATGSEKLVPDGAVTGIALVVYDPGVSGTAKDTAARIASDLKSRGYEVTLAGVKSAAAASVSGYDVIVAGGPVYAGKVSGSIYSYLGELQVPDDTKVGAFATGKYPDNNKVEVAFPDAASMDSTLMLYPDQDDIVGKCAGFVEELLR